MLHCVQKSKSKHSQVTFGFKSMLTRLGLEPVHVHERREGQIELTAEIGKIFCYLLRAAILKTPFSSPELSVSFCHVVYETSNPGDEDVNCSYAPTRVR